ncbi:MAG: DUF4837 family protein [Rikenellaceae bacterium]|nr:DUF4837 family protein [Rikenellaceae bacterium]
MKKILLFALLAGAVGFTSCGERSNPLRTSTGKPYELFVVMPDDKWEGAVGDTLRSILWEPFPMVNQYEPFYATFQTNEEQFINLLRMNRNVLFYRTGSAYTKPEMCAEYDKWANPQIVVYLTGPTDSAAMAYADEHREALRQVFDIAELDRFIYRAQRFNDKEITDRVFDQFGLRINIPKGYKVAAEHPDFMWIRYEAPLISQGIVIYKYPLTNRRTFTEPYLLKRRNEFVSLIPGPNEGTYMTTSDVMIPQLAQVTINNRIWFMSQGFWDVKGGFMGGPFTSYSTANATTREVITIDTYVFSPKYDKRNYVRQLQAIAQTALIPGDTIHSIDFSTLPVEE